MNRTFLIFLMIGSAMLIAVIGQQKPTIQHDYAPWDVITTENGAIQVFGMTPGKTTIKESKQILSKASETQLLIAGNKNQQRQLIAIHKDLMISGLLSELRLAYQLEQNTLNELYSTLDIKPEAPGMEKSYSITPELEEFYSSTPIASITYIPSINYGEEVILQRFGTPTEERVISDTERQWHYPEIGLEIQLYSNQAERFIYSNPK